MSTERCKLCKIDNTPWEMIPELNGHICVECSYFLCSLENEFEQYTQKAVRIVNDLDFLKRITNLLVNRWSKEC